MPWLYPIDESGVPGIKHGRIDLTAKAGGPVTHELVYNTENIATVSIEAVKPTANDSFGTTAAMTAKMGVSGQAAGLEAFSSAVSLADFGPASNRTCSARPRMVIKLDTVGGGSPAGQAELWVWGEPAR